MRLASFNVENLFGRAKVMNTATWPEGEPGLAAFETFNRTANNAVYSEADKTAMLGALETLKVLRRTGGGALRLERTLGRPLAFLRENRGDFISQPNQGDVRIVASGRADWVGWVELDVEPVDELAVRSTARVINDLAADILAVVEAENRPALAQFNTERLGGSYQQVMLIDGNDRRGIDVGILTLPGFGIRSARSHVDDPDPQTGRPLFSHGPRPSTRSTCRQGPTFGSSSTT